MPEAAVNRWVLQFYFHQAMRAYRAGRARDFRELRDVMQGARGRGPRGHPGVTGRGALGVMWGDLGGRGARDPWAAAGRLAATPDPSFLPVPPSALLVRPLAQEPAVSRLLRIMQLLSRIEEGENLGRKTRGRPPAPPPAPMLRWKRAGLLGSRLNQN